MPSVATRVKVKDITQRETSWTRQSKHCNVVPLTRGIEPTKLGDAQVELGAGVRGADRRGWSEDAVPATRHE